MRIFSINPDNMTSNPRPYASRAAFTLIELLTVIAIIGILAAIIIPTVGKVRKVAKNAECVSNLRQWGTAVLLYSNENKGNYVIQSPAGNAWISGSADTYQPYIPSRLLVTIRVCPLREDYGAQNPGGPAYLMNRPFIGTGSTAADVKAVPLRKVTQPSMFPLVMDTHTAIGSSAGYSFLGVGSINTCVAPLFNVPQARHEGKANAVFADAHVQRITQADVTEKGAMWTRIQ